MAAPPPPDPTPRIRRPNRRALDVAPERSLPRDLGGGRWTPQQARAVARSLKGKGKR